MIFGMTTFTIVHVLLSLIGIFSGFVVVFGLLVAKRLDGWTALFLASTVLTSVTGFLFPFHGFLPSHGRRTYVITAVIALYLNVFVFIVQLFRKVPALKALAPTQSEEPFKVAQLVALVIFVVLASSAAIRFRSGQPHTA